MPCSWQNASHLTSVPAPAGGGRSGRPGNTAAHAENHGVEEFQEETTKPRRNRAISRSGCATAPSAAGWGRFCCLCVQFTSLHPNPGRSKSGARSTVLRARSTGHGLHHRQNEPGACSFLTEGRQALAALPGQKSSVSNADLNSNHISGGYYTVAEQGTNDGVRENKLSPQ